MPSRRPVAALCALGAAFAFLAGVPVQAATPMPAVPSVAPSGPEPCVDLPLSSLDLHPSSCWITGPTSVVVAGVDPRTAAGAVIVVQEQQKLRATLPGAAGLRITGVANGQACVSDQAGQVTGVDLASGATSNGCALTQGTLPRTGVQAAAAPSPESTTGASAPPATTSYYVYGAYLPQCGTGATTGCPLFTAGAADTTPGLVVLDFGAPCYNPNTLVYGTQLFNSFECTADAQLLPLAQAWIRGYESANPAGAAVSILGLGSSNSVTGALPPTYSLTPNQMYSAGSAWFTNVVRPVSSGPTGAAPITFWAASDIEESTDGNWYDPATSRPWVDGYQASVGAVSGPKCGASTPYQMVDYGDSHPGLDGWGAGDIYYVAWGARLACALPEIYYSGNENGWVQLNQWAGANHAGPISFTGVMSEDGASGSLSAPNSWSTLANATGQAPPYLTVITGGNGPATPFGAPTNVAAVPGAGSATVSWSAPQLDGGRHITSYTITPYIGAVAQTGTVITAARPPVTTVVSGLTNGTTYTFTVSATNVNGTGPESGHSNGVTPSDLYPYTAVSTTQYTLTNSNGTDWSDMDGQALSLSITPSRDATAVLTANADLWTANAGINQDLGIDVNGTLAAWKESGGYGGTYSPNAAFVQTTFPMTHGVPYTVKLRWKTNKPQGTGVIFAGAGGNPFSPTRLTVALASPSTINAVSGSGQYHLKANDGSTWVPVDPSLTVPVLATAGSVAVIGGNADLWTAAAGYNQDLGISIDGAPPIAWKESGGYAGTYSPNAAFVLATATMPAGQHQVSLVWKANKAVPANTVFAGAGPNPYSPSTLTVQWLPSTSVMDASSPGQYTLSSSDGSGWVPVDTGALTLTITPATPCLAVLSGNADLWTSTAGVNQDLAITVTPYDAVTYPGAVAGWKESGGYAGTFSPNAAFVQALEALNPGTTYSLSLAWKTNSSSSGAAHAGAGQAPGYSPTRLTAVMTCA